MIVRLKTLGRHQIYNALQAAAVGYFAGMDLDEICLGLESAQFPHMRMEPVTINGVRFVNDCYNANVVSMKAALEMIRETPCNGRKVAVLGDMLELGRYGRKVRIAMSARRQRGPGPTLLVTVGESARLIAEGAIEAGMEAHRVLSLATAEEAGELLRELAHERDFILIKGSRGLRMEQMLEEFKVA